MEDKQFKEISKKLDLVIALLAVQNAEDKDDKIYIMKKAGLTSEEISPYIGIKNVRETKGWKRK